MTKIIYLCITAGRKNDIVMHQKYIEMFVTIIYLGHGHTIITYAAINFGSAIRIDLEFESIFNLEKIVLTVVSAPYTFLTVGTLP